MTEAEKIGKVIIDSIADGVARHPHFEGCLRYDVMSIFSDPAVYAAIYAEAARQRGRAGEVEREPATANLGELASEYHENNARVDAIYVRYGEAE
jgi:hypothetical protein